MKLLGGCCILGAILIHNIGNGSVYLIISAVLGLFGVFFLLKDKKLMP